MLPVVKLCIVASICTYVLAPYTCLCSANVIGPYLYQIVERIVPAQNLSVREPRLDELPNIGLAKLPVGETALQLLYAGLACFICSDASCNISLDCTRVEGDGS